LIIADKLSKRYRIGGKRQRYKTLREQLANTTRSSWRKIGSVFRAKRNPSTEAEQENTFWALKDVSFEIKRGEVVGIVGRNGAGKTTLLKLLSRITEPTAGCATLHGRLGSLLEVGTGFHNELTGRENIYLNGAILGMKRAEINRKLDEIIAFAEVEKFIDTPVKHYSSGMYMRLAFSVAAHLEPEILLIDEVLAVGDSVFQKKCLGKMEDIGKEGRTVLFVSHNLAAVRSLCNKGLLLQEGRLIESGDIGKIIETYYRSLGQTMESATEDNSTHSRFGPVTLNGSLKPTLLQSEGFEVSTTLNIKDALGGFTLHCLLEDMHGEQIFHARQESPQLGLTELAAGRYNIALRLPPLWLNPGLYSLYFKVLYWGEFASSRHVSDRLLIDVTGESSAVNALLHPHSSWSVYRSSERASRRNALAVQ
jgi:lipopolysaccharide transport system ATP-binding protein